MTLSTASRFLNKMLLATAVAGMGLTAASCDSLIYDDQGDCSVHYRLTFKYTANPMLLTSAVPDDAFGSQVDELN
ncbi:MAG: FimB/Mfa2 family fimbrial subunit, partial [Duncaniella sp.]|nr:FimB/Mfa2 family fimbrial subunit [Duncaniella sp.]